MWYKYRERNYDKKDSVTIDSLLIPSDIDMKTERDIADDVLSSIAFDSAFYLKNWNKNRKKNE